MGKFREMRAAGGFLDHLVPYGSQTALCGFTPGAKLPAGRQMKYRHGWTNSNGFRKCRRCAALAAKAEKGDE